MRARDIMKEQTFDPSERRPTGREKDERRRRENVENKGCGNVLTQAARCRSEQGRGGCYFGVCVCARSP